MDTARLTLILEAMLLAADRPIPLKQFQEMLDQGDEAVQKAQIVAALEALAAACAERSYELVEVASGFRLQVRAVMEPWVSRLWEEKPPRYSRALLETLAIIAYRQPITRADIEDIRGVSVSTQIVRTLQEREWIQVVGHRDLPGRPAMFGTTRRFLDYFNLKSLDELPTLAELRDLDRLNPELGLENPAAESVVEVSPGGSAGSPAGPDGTPAAAEEGVPATATLSAVTGELAADSAATDAGGAESANGPNADGDPDESPPSQSLH